VYHYRAHDGATEEWHFSTEDSRRHRIVAMVSDIPGYWEVKHYEEMSHGPRKLLHTASAEAGDEVDEVVATLMDLAGYTNKH